MPPCTRHSSGHTTATPQPHSRTPKPRHRVCEPLRTVAPPAKRMGAHTGSLHSAFLHVMAWNRVSSACVVACTQHIQTHRERRPTTTPHPMQHNAERTSVSRSAFMASTSASSAEARATRDAHAARPRHGTTRHSTFQSAQPRLFLAALATALLHHRATGVKPRSGVPRTHSTRLLTMNCARHQVEVASPQAP